MLAAQRQQLLLERLASDGRIVAKDVATELGLSEDSIRRDLREMAAAGLCQRVYGGALPVSPAIADLKTRKNVQPDSKSRVAARAAQLITAGRTAIRMAASGNCRPVNCARSTRTPAPPRCSGRPPTRGSASPSTAAPRSWSGAIPGRGRWWTTPGRCGWSRPST